VEAFTSAGFLHRKGLQYHWRNRDRTIDSSSSSNSSNNNSNGQSVDVNNGAGKGATADPTVLLKTTPITPPEKARQMAADRAQEEEGSGGGGGDGDGDVGGVQERSNTKYANFDSYLGNFASKRRIKASFADPLCASSSQVRRLA